MLINKTDVFVELFVDFNLQLAKLATRDIKCKVILITGF